MKRSLRLRLMMVVLAVIWAGSVEGATGTGDWVALTTPPADTLEAERVRIWVPIVRQSRCRVTIDILDDSSRVVRRLLNRLLGGGYYNFYWDKKDDAGGWVPEGQYTYVVTDDCGPDRDGHLTAWYREWERESRVIRPGDKWSPSFELELLRDSALVSVLIFNRRGHPVDSLVVDSLMSAGQHRFNWRPAGFFPRGLYTAEVRVGDFIHVVEFGYRP